MMGTKAKREPRKVPQMLQGAQFEYLQYMVKDNGEAITTWCLLELTFLEECWKRFDYFSDYYQRSSSCWISSPRTRRAAEGTLHKVWIPTTGCIPQDAVELHPAEQKGVGTASLTNQPKES